MIKKLLHMFGDRVLFQEVNEEISGTLVLLQQKAKQYELGRVLLVGDGKTKDALGNVKTTKMLVNKDDIVWFQVNPYMAQFSTIKIDGQLYMHAVQNDLIARLKKPRVSIENFEVLGWWVLLDQFEDQNKDSMIVLPENAGNEVRMLRYVIKQKGAFVENVSVGQEVIVDKKMANPVEIDGKMFFYIDSRYIYGAFDMKSN